MVSEDYGANESEQSITFAGDSKHIQTTYMKSPFGNQFKVQNAIIFTDKQICKPWYDKFLTNDSVKVAMISEQDNCLNINFIRIYTGEYHSIK